MIEADGMKIATPAYDNMVRSVEDMQDGVFYPSGCFAEFQLARGRMLSHALGQDPASPVAVKVKNAKCYTRAQIVEYLAGYGDDFANQAAEVNARGAALRARDEIALLKQRAEADEEFAAIKAEKARLNAAYQASLEKFSKDFIDKYASDISRATSSVCGVYFLRSGNEIVYIGQSRNVYNRITEHRKSKTFDRVDFLQCDKRQLDELEGFFIRLLRPALNGHDEGKIYGAPKSLMWGDVVTLAFE